MYVSKLEAAGIAQIILVVVNISVDYKSHKGQGKISPDQRRDLLSGDMFFGLFYPLLFELSALIPDPTFSKGLLDAFVFYPFIVFSVRTLMLAIFVHLY